MQFFGGRAAARAKGNHIALTIGFEGGVVGNLFLTEGAFGCTPPGNPRASSTFRGTGQILGAASGGACDHKEGVESSLETGKVVRLLT